MFAVRRHVEIDAGHRVPFHGGHCRNLHGHRYKVTAIMEAPDLVPPDAEFSDAGMVVDFGVIKAALMREVHAKFDHKLILWDQDPLSSPELYIMLERESIQDGVVLIPCIPTAEELARYWGQMVAAELTRLATGLRMQAFEVQETPTSIAVWTP